MSIQLTLIPIYFGKEYLINIDEESYENNIAAYIEDNIEFNVTLSESIKERTNEKFGKKTVIPTTIRDKNILINSLSKYTQRFKDKEQLEDFADMGSITVEEAPNGTYNLCFQGYFRQYEIDEITTEILREYKEDLQEITYNKVLKKLKENNLNIDSEDITQDDSIILTVSI